jgi:hypothetical protein
MQQEHQHVVLTAISSHILLQLLHAAPHPTALRHLATSRTSPLSPASRRASIAETVPVRISRTAARQPTPVPNHLTTCKQNKRSDINQD